MNSEDTEVTRAFVDRIEDDLAVLLLDEDVQLELPLRLLPTSVNEGDWLILRLTIDEAETEARRQSIDSLRQRLGADDDGGDLDL